MKLKHRVLNEQLKSRGLILLLWMVFFSCAENTPKPSAYLRLAYPKPTYKSYRYQNLIQFEHSNIGHVKEIKKDWFNIQYPKLKATLMMTYHPIKGNLDKILRDSEQLTFKHSIKADDISSRAFEEGNIKAQLFEVTGNVASNLQFNVTDQKNHFVSGALYFYSKPNYDSIRPALEYLKRDIIHLIENMEFKDVNQ